MSRLEIANEMPRIGGSESAWFNFEVFLVRSFDVYKYDSAIQFMWSFMFLRVKCCVMISSQREKSLSDFFPFFRSIGLRSYACLINSLISSCRDEMLPSLLQARNKIKRRLIATCPMGKEIQVNSSENARKLAIRFRLVAGSCERAKTN